MAWITTLDPPKAFPPAQVRRLGQDRWILDLENNGWNDLTQHWAAWKHGFLHRIALKPLRKTADASRSSTAGWPPSPSSCYWPSHCPQPLLLCSLSFQTRSSLRLDRHRGGFSTAALAIQASAQPSCSRLARCVSQNSSRITSLAYLAVSHAFLSRLPWRKQKCVFPQRNASHRPCESPLTS